MPTPLLSALLRRRTVLALAAAGAALPAPAASRITLRISSPAVPDDWHARMWTVLRDTLEQRAPGQFDVQIHLGGSLFKQGAEAVALARGNLELASISAFDIAKIVPAFSIFTAGYVIRDPDHLLKVFNGPIGAELYARVSEQMDLTVLAPLYLGTRQLNLRQARRVMVPQDLQGLKLRMPASREWLFLGQALGATPTPLAFGEVYLGLKTGTIDGQENPLSTVRSAKFYEVTQQITLTGHLVDCLFIVVSNRLWQRLTPAQQAALRAAAQAAARYNDEHRIADERELVGWLKAQGLQVTTPDVAAFRQAVQRAYLASDLARAWPAGLLERIQAVR